jgi:hypothetical protein
VSSCYIPPDLTGLSPLRQLGRTGNDSERSEKRKKKVTVTVRRQADGKEKGEIDMAKHSAETFRRNIRGTVTVKHSAGTFAEQVVDFHYLARTAAAAPPLLSQLN